MRKKFANSRNVLTEYEPQGYELKCVKGKFIVVFYLSNADAVRKRSYTVWAVVHRRTGIAVFTHVMTLAYIF